MSHPLPLQSFPKVDVIRLGRRTQKRPRATIVSQIARAKKFPFPLNILASPRTTVILGTLLPLGRGAKVISTLKKGLLAAIGVGALEKSEKLEKFIIAKGRPFKAGEFIGGQIEQFGKKPTGTLKERIKEGAKKAGLIGAGVAAAAGVVAVVKKARERVKDIGVPTLPTGKLPLAPASALLIQPTQPIAPRIEPLAPVKKAVEEEKPKEVVPAMMPSINTKITVKPQINISFRKTRRFINQQILIRR